jgi:hypothetical protein
MLFVWNALLLAASPRLMILFCLPWDQARSAVFERRLICQHSVKPECTNLVCNDVEILLHTSLGEKRFFNNWLSWLYVNK